MILVLGHTHDQEVGGGTGGDPGSQCFAHAYVLILECWTDLEAGTALGEDTKEVIVDRVLLIASRARRKTKRRKRKRRRKRRKKEKMPMPMRGAPRTP